MRIILFTLFWGCTVTKKSSSTGDTEASSLDPSADEDGDGISNGEEEQAGSDPYNPDDVPYIGGWGKDAECRFDIVSTGNDVGQVAENFGLEDQYGDTVYLHDFCGRPLLIEFAGFTWTGCISQVSGLEYWRKELEAEGFLPILVMYDGSPTASQQLAEDKDLNFPILLDKDYSLFDRWNPTGVTPSTTMIRRGSVVHSIDETWYTGLIEEVVEWE